MDATGDYSNNTYRLEFYEGTFNFNYLLQALLSASCNKNDDEWIRINQLGYRTDDIKVAVFISLQEVSLTSFRLVDVNSGNVVLVKNETGNSEPLEPFKSCYRLSFTEFTAEGIYRIEAGDAVSP